MLTQELGTEEKGESTDMVQVLVYNLFGRGAIAARQRTDKAKSPTSSTRYSLSCPYTS